MTFKNIEEIGETEDTFIYYVNITSLYPERTLERDVYI